MDKKRLTTILAKADSAAVAALSADVLKNHNAVIVKEPTKTLAMIKMREPVEQSLFYIGEVIVCEAAVELEGTKGKAVCMGGDTDKTLHMAISDAAINKGVFADMPTLLKMEEEQIAALQRENAMHMKTMVNFTSMDGEAPQDVSAFQKT